MKTATGTFVIPTQQPMLKPQGPPKRKTQTTAKTLHQTLQQPRMWDSQGHHVLHIPNTAAVTAISIIFVLLHCSIGRRTQRQASQLDFSFCFRFQLCTFFTRVCSTNSKNQRSVKIRAPLSCFDARHVSGRHDACPSTAQGASMVVRRRQVLRCYQNGNRFGRMAAQPSPGESAHWSCWRAGAPRGPGTCLCAAAEAFTHITWQLSWTAMVMKRTLCCTGWPAQECKVCRVTLDPCAWAMTWLLWRHRLKLHIPCGMLACFTGSSGSPESMSRWLKRQLPSSRSGSSSSACNWMEKGASDPMIMLHCIRQLVMNQSLPSSCFGSSACC